MRLKFIIILFVAFACSEVSNAPQLQSQNNCDAFIQITTENEFNAIADAEFNIEAVSINQNCLSITVTDSGCNPVNWDINLFTTDAVLESNPLQKELKVELINNEVCLAVFSKTKTFDLTPIQMGSESEIILNIEGWNTQVSYTY